MSAENRKNTTEQLELMRLAQIDLEWPGLVAAVRARCKGPLAYGDARGAIRDENFVDVFTGFELAADFESTERGLLQLREAMHAERLAEPIPTDGIRDIRKFVERAKRAGVLEAHQLHDIAVTLDAAKTLRVFLARRKETMPQLFAACLLDPTLDRLKDELTAAIDSDGTLSDRASPLLAKLRSEIRHLRARIVERLEGMLLQHADIVQDRFHTLRDGRYVIPIRTDAHEKLPGIVHGTSKSGASVFVEPRALIETQNRLTIATGELEIEEQRILALLTELVEERANELVVALDALDLADVRAAAARFARDFKGVVPEFSKHPIIALKQARHPVLVLDGEQVVPNDVYAEAGKSVVISGPNAGGKTVALKMMGLAALCVRAAIPVLAEEGGTVGFFHTLVSDIGDNQSIEKSLSTFSAQIVRLRDAIELASSGAMVLLDEIATGTDPEEGSALAVALLETLSARGAAVAVTTHYDRLKSLALSDPRYRNASVGYDFDALRPTFSLRWDVPGASSALVVASRFGLPEFVLKRAEALIKTETRDFEQLVQALSGEVDKASKERAQLAELRLQFDRERERLDAEQEKLRNRDRQKLGAEAEKVRQVLSETRTELQQARKTLSRAERERELFDAAKEAVERAAVRLQTTEQDTSTEGELRGTAVTSEEVSLLGERVFVPRLNGEFQVVEGPNKGRVRVAHNSVRLWVDLAEVRLLKDAPKAAKETERDEKPTMRRVSPGRGGSEFDQPLMPDGTPAEIFPVDVTLRLIGMHVEDAVPSMEAFLDRMYGRGEKAAMIVHGQGSGALREALREFLSQHAAHYVKRYRPGDAREGGDKVTIVYLK